jgi:hypothetical protein
MMNLQTLRYLENGLINNIVDFDENIYVINGSIVAEVDDKGVALSTTKYSLLTDEQVQEYSNEFIELLMQESDDNFLKMTEPFVDYERLMVA